MEDFFRALRLAKCDCPAETDRRENFKYIDSALVRCKSLVDGKSRSLCTRVTSSEGKQVSLKLEKEIGRNLPNFGDYSKTRNDKLSEIKRSSSLSEELYLG